jgi:serine/threonine protein kinase
MQPAPAICQVCQTPHAPAEIACDNCGLIFASYMAPDGPAAQPRCPACAQPVRPHARVCGACGTPLTQAYAPLPPGRSLANGRYTIQRAISRGGMGAIYLAIDHETFDRPVVVKAMLDYFDPTKPQEVATARARFLQEAQTLALLRHPAIPQIFGYFQDGPHNYIVMEYVEGHDLDYQLTHVDESTGATIPGRPYDHEDVLRWGVALCQVLEYLASRRPDPVVHHDIKPANLLLDRNSAIIRLVDFGTARARLLAQSGGGVGLQQSSVFGTQGYAAPEQYVGQSEPRSDVYALAATLYHLATDDDPRQHPFTFPRLDQLGLLSHILQDALDPRAARRPSAVELRRRLESAIVPTAAPVLYAPDGAAIYDTAALVRWCEADWWQTLRWLRYGNLPEQIERRWGMTRLAQELHDLKRQDDGNHLIDRMLVLLDPHGFGKASPRLKADRPEVDFGALRGRSGDAALTITNDSRRYVEAAIDLPAWLIADRATFTLVPGQQVTIVLQARLRGIWFGGRVWGAVRVRDRSQVQLGYSETNNFLLSVPVRASASFWATIVRRTLRGQP